MIQWFIGKQLFFDEKGVYYFVNSQKYYVLDQVMIITIKNKQRDSMIPTTYMKMFVNMHADPDIKKYFFTEKNI